jgi:DNA processing protein
LERIPGIGKERASMIQQKNIFERAEKEVRFIEKNGIRALYFLDKEYPSRLKQCEDSPLMVFYKGHGDLNAEKMIAIVGTRHVTPYGKETTEKLIMELAAYNVTIISGLAFGVDVHAHKQALKQNLPTLGVLAHGLDRIYPAEHKITADKMIHQGGLLSEYPSSTKPDRNNFPARNRIVAGLSDAVIIIESAEKGGALITAELANDYNREVFALPGRINDHFSKGCHRLIMQNKAHLFENAGHVAEIMGWDDVVKKTEKYIQGNLFHNLNEEELKVVQVLELNGLTAIDYLSLNTQIPIGRLSSLLLSLEFKGMLRSLPGKCYELSGGKFKKS